LSLRSDIQPNDTPHNIENGAKTLKSAFKMPSVIIDGNITGSDALTN
jgi:hypothetical protein